MSLFSSKEMEGDEPLVQARKAINYALMRIHQNPQIGWHMGAGTQAFALLTEALATLTNQPVEGVRRKFAPVFTEKTDTEIAREIRDAHGEYESALRFATDSTSVAMAEDKLVAAVTKALANKEELK